MHQIPEGVMRLWDVWDIRLLVVLSLTLQIILSIFGHRRKYIPSPWINIFVWSAYLTADWVATVALGKLSDAQVNNDHDNPLRAIWAPLLLLHLGGPDGITAYSLEDNQLWMRHLLGLVVQSSVAIYVILMSWKFSWFSFMSFPALAAGIIKYGERTWVLKSVSDDKSGDIVPFKSIFGTNRSDYVDVLSFACFYLTYFKGYMEEYDLRHNPCRDDNRATNINFLWKALEVEMGLMYDLLYTKASINYKKRGCILRCISFACTITVLVGLISRVIFMKEEKTWHKVDIAITGVLLVGALTLEIYSVIALHLSSEWAMLWLINYGRFEDVIKLRRKIPWLSNNKKSWSKMIGQFNLPSFHIEDAARHQKLSTRILRGLLGIIKCKVMFNRYVNRTFVPDNPQLYSTIFDYCQHLMSSSTCGGDVDESSGINEERELLKSLHVDGFDIPRRIISIHILTEICYHLENDWDGPVIGSEFPRLDEQNRKTTITLSHYMMYLLAMHPSLLSVSRAASDHYLLETREEERIKASSIFNGEQDLKSFLHLLEGGERFKAAVVYLKGKPNEERWKILKFVWLRMLFYAAIKGQKDVHLQHLRQGGELLTLLWFFLPQCSMLRPWLLEPGKMCDIIERIERIR